MTILDTITALASTATAVGVIIAVFQLWHSEKIAKSEFEDQFRRDYRDICSKLPVKVFLGHPLSEEELSKYLGQFHQYFHLCNSQIFLRSQKKISKITWKMWSGGIRANFELIAFQQAWKHIHTAANNHRLEYITRYVEKGCLDPATLGIIEQAFDDNISTDGELLAASTFECHTDLGLEEKTLSSKCLNHESTAGL